MPCRTLLGVLWMSLFLHAFGDPAHAQAGEIAAPPVYSLESLLDSADVHAQLATMLVPVPELRQARLFSVRFDSAGQPDTVTPTFPRLMPEGYARAVSPLIQSRLRGIPSGSSKYYDLLVQAGPQPVVQVVQLAEEPLRVLNRAEVERAAMRGIPWGDKRVKGRMTVMIRLLVDENGRPADIQLISSSGVDELDQVALAAAARFRFVPYRLDGIPLRVRMEFPLNFSFDGSGPASGPETAPHP